MLESRTMMAADANPWHNYAFPGDVDGSGELTPRDVLTIVNSLNSGGARQLFMPTASGLGAASGAEAESPERIDVDNDGWVAPVDALRLVNLLNGEGENAVMSIGLTATKLDGTTLPIDSNTGFPAVNVGESFLVQMVTRDLRVVPSGVAAAYADVTFNDKVSFDTRETQLITFTSAPNTGTFTLTVSVPGQAAKTTGNISYIKNNPQQTRDNIIAALLSPTIGFFQPGEVIAEKPRPKTSGPAEGTNYAIKFGGRYADINMPEMTAAWTSTGSTTIAVQQYNTWVTTPPVPTSPTFPMSLTYDMFRDAMTASLGEGANPNVLNESGASTFDTSDGETYLVFEAQFTALAGGTVVFGTNPGEETASAPLLHGSGGTDITTADVDFQSLSIVVLQKVTAVNDALTVNEDSLGTSASNRVDVMANDTLNAGGTKRIVSFTQGANGTVSLFNNGTASNTADDQLTYQPNANFSGTDTFTYVFGDGQGNTATATVSVTVNGVNDAPVNTVPGAGQTTAEDVAKTFSSANGNAFSVNDIDAGTANIQVAFTATNGTVALVNASGVTVSGSGASITLTGSQANINTALAAGLTYTPTANFSGSGTIVMSTNDQGNSGGAALTDTDTVSISITAVNDAPVNTIPAGLQTDEGVALTITSLSVADIDAASGSVRTTLSVTAGSGLLQLLSTSGVTVSGNNSNSVQITGTLTALNAALAGGVRFTPASGFAGNTTLSMLTTDQGNTGAGGALTDTDSTILDVRPLVRPRASNDLATAAEDSLAAANVINVLANDTPNVGATLVLKSFTQPANGTVTQQGTTLLFQPAADFFGTTTFTYTINDSLEGQPEGGVDSTATVSVTVTEVNDAPVTVADTKSTSEDAPLSFPASDLTGNDSRGAANESSQTLTVTLPSGTTAKGGTVTITSGQITYTPPANYNNLIGGPDTFTYTATDNGTTNGVASPLSAVGTVTINITEVNDAPTAVADAAAGTTPEDPAVPLTINGSTLTANDLPGGGADEAGQVLTVTGAVAVTGSAGTVSVVGGNVVYAPAANYNGPFVFTYTVQDNGTTNGTSDPKTVTGTATVTVTEVNDDPTAGNDSVVGVKDTASEYTSAQLLGNDTKGPANESTQTLRIVSVSPTSTLGGTVSLNTTTGVVTYTPPTGVDGQSDSFTYTVSDNGTTAGVLDEKTAVGTVTVGIVNYIPMTFSGAVYMDVDNDGAIDAGEATLGGVDVTLSGTDFNGAAITSQTVTTGRNGAYSFSGLAPGNYFIIAGQAANTVDGRETAGSSVVTLAANDRFAFNVTLSQNVAMTSHTFANNNFGERGLSSSYLSLQYLLASSQDTAAADNDNAMFSFSDASGTNLDWYTFIDGWDNVQLQSITLSADMRSATLRVLNAASQSVQTTVSVDSARLRVRTDSAGRPVVNIVGGYADFNWVAANGGSGEGEGEGEEAPAEMIAAAMSGNGDYAGSVDACFAEDYA